MGSTVEDISSSSGVTDNSAVTPSSPLYLLPSDSPGTILVTTTIDGTGYGSWCNDMVVAWILNSLDREIRETVMYAESAEKLWKEIERRFSQASGIKIFQIRKEISSISQGSSSISSYFNRIKKLWDELSFSVSYPDCVCGCKETYQRLDEEQKVHQFLMGLNESYSTIRRNILMMKPLPDVDSVYSILVNDESQSSVQANVPSLNSDSTAFSAGVQKSYSQRVNFDTQRASFNPSRKNNIVCRYCKKPGHQIEKCYKRHGYPSGFQTKFKRTVAFAQVSDTPPVGHSENSAGDTKIVQSDGGNSSITKEQFDQLLSLLLSRASGTSQEISTCSANFAALIGNPDFKSCGLLACNFSRVEDSTWIIDSGATHHMTPNSSFLTDIKPLVLPYLVTLPNGYKVKVICTGTLTLSSEISLTHVLLVPSFQYNLISLAQLVLQLNCLAYFSSIACVLQGPSLKKPVGLGSLQNRLYILNPANLVTSESTFHPSFVNTITASTLHDLNKSSSSTSNLASSVSVNADVSSAIQSHELSFDHSWHLRLGHMPFNKMKSIPFLSDKLSKKQTYLCPICPMARQQ
ncbi:PREDICTED: uncharacterized protein LOC109206313 [Nicotiana attenuata]|uniref:uncharacterized protein LOC109206313 n=1 Tax=Nicotiana attenuata TaxID=49451 RepID=UPI000904BC7E|nr:PREDICTED: uncharacterized protein LOC109206313 [Nicotiana attenuata]